MKKGVTWIKYGMTYCFLIVSCIQGYTQIILNAPIGNTNYEWFHEDNLITGAITDKYEASIPGTYYATYIGTNNCTQASSFFVLVDNCNIGQEVDLVVEPACTYENITWLDGGIGEAKTVMTTNILTAYTATINIDDIYSNAYNFYVMQFDTICCTINNSGIITLIPFNN